MNQQKEMRITPKIITANGYIKNGLTITKPQSIKVCDQVEKKNSIAERLAMREKLILELRNLLRTERIESRAYAYEIMREQGFLPIVAEEREMGFARFKEYYTQARRMLGISSFTGSRKEYILSNYEKMSVDRIAAHVGSKPIYVQQTIAKFKRTGK